MKIKLGRVIDLTHKIHNEMIVYVGDPKPRIERVKELSKDGVNLTKVEIGVHTGTHVDAPIHFFMKGVGVDELPVEQFIGEAVVLDLSYKQAGSAICKNDLERYSNLVKKGDIVLLYTGMSLNWDEEWARTKYTYLEVDGAEWLIEKGVKTVGIDFLSIEKFNAQEPKTHKILLGSGIAIIESINSELRNLVGERILLICLPIKIKGSDGAPARAIAYYIDDGEP